MIIFYFRCIFYLKYAFQTSLNILFVSGQLSIQIWKQDRANNTWRKRTRSPIKITYVAVNLCCRQCTRLVNIVLQMICPRGAYLCGTHRFCRLVQLTVTQNQPGGPCRRHVYKSGANSDPTIWSSTLSLTLSLRLGPTTTRSVSVPRRVCTAGG